MDTATGPGWKSDAAGALWQHPLHHNETSMEEKMGPSPNPPPYERVIDMNAPPSAPIWQQYPQSNGTTEATPLNIMAPAGREGRDVQTKKSIWTIPTVDVGCFGCCSLETCCKVQGYFSAIGSVIVCFVAIFIMCGSALISSTETYRHDDQDEKTAMTVLSVLIAIIGFVLIVLSIITFVCAVRFIKGINQRQPNMMVPYIRILYVHLIFQVIDMFLKPANIPEVILYLAICSYNVICARSLHEKMLKESEDQIRNRNVV